MVKLVCWCWGRAKRLTWPSKNLKNHISCFGFFSFFMFGAVGSSPDFSRVFSRHLASWHLNLSRYSSHVLLCRTQANSSHFTFLCTSGWLCWRGFTVFSTARMTKEKMEFLQVLFRTKNSWTLGWESKVSRYRTSFQFPWCRGFVCSEHFEAGR